MKYIIELPEYVKNEVDKEEDVDKAEDFIKWWTATLTREIKDSIPLQEELEKIKAEINEYLIASFADDEDFRWFNLCLDAHIKELNNEKSDSV